jgi:fluoride exporter
MNTLLLIASGGAIGSLLRYGLATFVQTQHASRFPWGTFCVNILGCAVAGILLAAAAKGEWLTQELRFFLFTGLLGGFTTFSAFGVETVQLIKQGEWLIASSYVAASVALGLLALGLAYWLVERV